MKDAAFHSEQEVYPEGTDTDEMYMKIKDRVIENLTVFQRGQSGWRFRSIVYRIGEFKPRLGLFKRFIRLREYPILKPILG